MKNIRERILSLLEEMARGAYEREDVIGLALLSAVAGESIFLLGLPGVGKSMVARRLKMAFKDSTSFEYLMSRFSTPDEIFGPVSISKLKDNDCYERVIDGYLPTADVVFLDEIWKAGPAIQNSLLTVLNEKIFQNGTQVIHLPLKAVISASNELPAEGEGLEALWDRFLLRYIVRPIDNKEMFMALLTGQTEDCHIPEEIKITATELDEMKQGIRSINVPDEITEVIYSIRKTIIQEKQQMSQGVDVTKSDLVEPPYVSDRRWRKIMGILKTSAYLNGRQQVDYSDCLLMNHMLWDKDEQINSVMKLVTEAMVKNIVHGGIPDIVSQVNGKRHTKPVGTPISPDGKHYVFVASDEEILIDKDDYESLSQGTPSYGIITNDNRLVLTSSPSSLMIKKTDEGLAVNSFKYPLKRDSSLRSGQVIDFLSDIDKNFGTMENHLQQQVNDNLFVPKYPASRVMRNAFDTIKKQMTRRGLR